MIKGWKKQLPDEQHEQFDKVFEEINTEFGSNFKQPQINVYLLNQLIRIRTELQKIKKLLKGPH